MQHRDNIAERPVAQIFEACVGQLVGGHLGRVLRAARLPASKEFELINQPANVLGSPASNSAMWNGCLEHSPINRFCQEGVVNGVAVAKEQPDDVG